MRSSPKKNTATVPGPLWDAMMVPMSHMQISPRIFGKRAATAAFAWSDFKKGADGLLPVVVQEDATDEVLMVAYMNEEAFNMTVETGRMTYYSRSRQSLWIKGETSGHFQ